MTSVLANKLNKNLFKMYEHKLYLLIIFIWFQFRDIMIGSYKLNDLQGFDTYSTDGSVFQQAPETFRKFFANSAFTRSDI